MREIQHSISHLAVYVCVCVCVRVCVCDTLPRQRRHFILTPRHFAEDIATCNEFATRDRLFCASAVMKVPRTAAMKFSQASKRRCLTQSGCLITVICTKRQNHRRHVKSRPPVFTSYVDVPMLQMHRAMQTADLSQLS